jgi:hypothetical protein
VGEQFKASLESGVMNNSRNELSHRTARNTKRHTSAIQKAQQGHAGQKKIAELRAQLAIAVAEAKVCLSPAMSFAFDASNATADQLIRRGSRNAEEQDQISRYSVLLPFLSLN